MKQLKYIIAEDNRLDELMLRDILSDYRLLVHAGTFSSIAEAEQYLKVNSPDIIFTDIEMPDKGGMDFVKAMHGKNPIIIFVTSHSEFALESFETSALDYLLKPVIPERFALTYRHILDYHEMITFARLHVEQSERETIVFKDGFSRIKLNVQEVIYLQAMQDYTKVVTAKKNYLVNRTLSLFVSENSQLDFIRIHRSYAVLRRHIKVLKPDTLTARYGTRVTAAMMAEGGYLDLDSNGNYWLPS